MDISEDLLLEPTALLFARLQVGELCDLSDDGVRCDANHDADAFAFDAQGAVEGDVVCVEDRDALGDLFRLVIVGFRFA